MLLRANRDLGPAALRRGLRQPHAARSGCADLRAADVPIGPLLQREEWLDSPLLASIGDAGRAGGPGARHGGVPGNPVNLVATPATLDRPAPTPGGGTALGLAAPDPPRGTRRR